MSDDDNHTKDAPSTAEVSVNWEGLKRFMGWQGSINELKKVELDQPAPAPARSRVATK